MSSATMRIISHQRGTDFNEKRMDQAVELETKHQGKLNAKEFPGLIANLGQAYTSAVKAIKKT